MIRLNKSRFAIDSDRKKKIDTTTVYLSDDKSQLSRRSLAYGRGLLYCIIFFSRKYWFDSPIVSIRSWFGIDSESSWFGLFDSQNKTRLAFVSELIRFTKKNSIRIWFGIGSIHEKKKIGRFGVDSIHKTKLFAFDAALRMHSVCTLYPVSKVYIFFKFFFCMIWTFIISKLWEY